MAKIKVSIGDFVEVAGSSYTYIVGSGPSFTRVLVLEEKWFSFWTDMDRSGDEFLLNFKGTLLAAEEKPEVMRRTNGYAYFREGKHHP